MSINFYRISCWVGRECKFFEYDNHRWRELDLHLRWSDKSPVQLVDSWRRVMAKETTDGRKHKPQSAPHPLFWPWGSSGLLLWICTPRYDCEQWLPHWSSLIWPHYWHGNDDWQLHHNNAHPQTAIKIQQFLTKNGMILVPRPPYLPDLAPINVSIILEFKGNPERAPLSYQKRENHGNKWGT